MSIQNRIKMVIKMHNLTASAFADKIGVQRSSVSHILTGRNNPSLDFIEKTLMNFPRVNADWLIMGKVNTEPDSFGGLSAVSVEDSNSAESNSVIKSTVNAREERKIDRVVIFYTDGTYELTMPLKTTAE